jgi:hypothetical protein
MSCMFNLRMFTIWSALAITLSTTSAGAPILLPLGLLTRGPVPANGVLRFPLGVTVRILAADGTEVPGSFIADGVWRPNVPFGLGTHVADVSYEAMPTRAEDRMFEVISAVEFDEDFIQVRVVSRVVAADVIEQVCCAAGNATAEPCSESCEPLCIPLAYSSQQTVDVYGSFDAESVLAQQIVLLIPNPPQSEGYFIEGSWPVTGSPDELCGVYEVFSWLDDTRYTITRCIVNPKPELDPIRELPNTFGHISECTAPPEGYVEPWCLAQAYTCEVELLSLPQERYQMLLAACDQYYALCDRTAPVFPSSPIVDSGMAAGAPPDTPRSSGGCVIRAEGTRAGAPWGFGVCVIIGLWLRRVLSARRRNVWQ